MKFGRNLRANVRPEWKNYYVNYDYLKRELKNGTQLSRWSDSNEGSFLDTLSAELDKVQNFQQARIAEFKTRLASAEVSVNRLIQEEREEAELQVQLRNNASGSDLEEQRTSSNATTSTSSSSEHDEGSDDDLDSDDEDEHGFLRRRGSTANYEERFAWLEHEVANLVADVHDIALHAKINFTAFHKILKKHDKQTGRSLKETFIRSFVEKRPFARYNWDALIVKLSKLYDLVRTRGHPVQGDSSAGGSQSAFVRQTTKYWVHADNLVDLKLAILRHLPVLVFNPNKEFELKDSAITSIYFDNEDLELYLGRLEKTEGAEAIRLRWYGDMNVKQIFVERKTHREDWTGEKSVKARFPIKESNVNAFLRGEYTMDEEFRALVAKGKKTEQEVDAMIQLANEVQYAIVTRKLRPVMRTFYNRTAFQLPGDARVRISLDTELTMVREDNWDGKIRSGDNWRRTDIGIDWPFDQLPKDDREMFKHGVLEVKLQTQFGQEPPKWVTDLVSSHLVEAVPKFSKFIHGCATLLPNRVDLVPFWLPQMEIDIKKPDTGMVNLNRPTRTPSPSGSGTHSPTLQTPDMETQGRYAEPVSEGEDDDDGHAFAAQGDEDKRTGLSRDAVAEAVAARTVSIEEERKKKAKGRDLQFEGDASRQQHQSTSATAQKPRALAINPLTNADQFDENFAKKVRDEIMKVDPKNQQAGDSKDGNAGASANGGGSLPERILTRDWTAQPGKKIAVPIRVEPKVYFASERTFLKWLQFGVLIGTISTTLLNFISPEDEEGLVAAGMFTLAALMAIAYSGIIFVHRAYKLRNRDADGLYYDKWGPSILCIVLGMALMANVWMRMTVDEVAKKAWLKWAMVKMLTVAV